MKNDCFVALTRNELLFNGNAYHKFKRDIHLLSVRFEDEYYASEGTLSVRKILSMWGRRKCCDVQSEEEKGELFQNCSRFRGTNGSGPGIKNWSGL